jgi:molybdenum cofactor cytidylyltransferase
MKTSPRRLFAVVPAAGRSRRMGQAKLLLPVGGQSVIVRLLDVLTRPQICDVFVVIRPDDAALYEEVAATAATIVRPAAAPPDMRDSVELALNEIRTRYSPTADDSWLLVPADHPVLDAALIGELIEHWNSLLEAESCTDSPITQSTAILVPRCGERRGHPTFFRWELADEVAQIPHDRGLNWLLERYADRIRDVVVDNPAVLTDLDTPEDYARLLGGPQ